MLLAYHENKTTLDVWSRFVKMIPLIFTVEVYIVTNIGYTCNVQNKYVRNRIKFCGLVSFHHMFLFSFFLVFKFKIKIEPKCKMKIHADIFYWECIFEMKDWNRFNRCKEAKNGMKRCKFLYGVKEYSTMGLWLWAFAT